MKYSTHYTKLGIAAQNINVLNMWY